MPRSSLLNSRFAGHLLLGAVVLAATLALSGCGGRRLSKVSGDVTLDGKPLPNASITFHPLSGGRPATATSDAAGHFALTSYNDGDGAAAGEYRVTVFASIAPMVAAPAGDGMALMDAERQKPSGQYVTPVTPLVYLNVEQTPLRATVPSAGFVKLELKSTGS